MGKKSKLKQAKKSSEILPENQPQNEANSDPNLYINNLEKQGYSFKNIKHAPDVPVNRTEPQV